MELGWGCRLREPLVPRRRFSRWLAGKRCVAIVANAATTSEGSGTQIRIRTTWKAVQVFFFFFTLLADVVPRLCSRYSSPTTLFSLQSVPQMPALCFLRDYSARLFSLCYEGLCFCLLFLTYLVLLLMQPVLGVYYFFYSCSFVK